MIDDEDESQWVSYGVCIPSNEPQQSAPTNWQLHNGLYVPRVEHKKHPVGFIWND